MVAAFVLAFSAVAVAGPTVSAQTAISSEDIALRDQLIANQENLLNTYRCLFGTDTIAVPGGCPDPDTITPAAAPQNPTQNDLDIRDQLIKNQEALLNAYRCQHNVDTQLVPNGCPTTNTDTPEPAAGTYTAVSAGDSYSCGVWADGSLECWGSASQQMPSGEFTAVSAGSGNWCGLRADRTLECGVHELFDPQIPSGEFTAVDVRGFGTHVASTLACGVRVDGSLECWGTEFLEELFGQQMPSGEFAAVSAGGIGVCGVWVDGSLECWGSASQQTPSGEFTAVSAGDYHLCGVRADRTIQCWGDNGAGQSDAPSGEFTAVSAGGFHSCGLRTDGTIQCWGAKNNEYLGEFALTFGKDIAFGQSDAPSGEFTAVSAGYRHSCGLRTDGTIQCWGDNGAGQLDAPSIRR